MHRARRDRLQLGSHGPEAHAPIPLQSARRRAGLFGGGRRAGALWMVVFAAAARASEGPPPVLNPKTYLSPSGEYRLHVDPSTMYGQGKATYRLDRGGQVAWEGARPFTLWDAGVTDDGVVAGYAYSHGWRGFPTEACRKETSEADWNGDFRV